MDEGAVIQALRYTRTAKMACLSLRTTVLSYCQLELFMIKHGSSEQTVP